MDGQYYAVIMAGGGGTRLWPLSRQAVPKQMLPLIADSTLFQTAVQRLQRVFPPERILVVTSRQQAAQLQEQAPELKPENFLLEPQPRGTAAAIGLAAACLQARDPGAIMAVLTADHYIGNESEFERYLLAAHQLAEGGQLVTLGIEPTYPATQFGYIQLGEALGEVGGFTAHKVLRFKEKPAAAEAAEMLAQGGYAWNSGMFIWKVSRIWEEFQQHMPELHQTLEKIAAAWGGPDFEAVLAHEWPRIAAQTIDYGVMERAAEVTVIPARDMGWNDVGSWDSLFEVLKVDTNGNLVLSERHLDIDSRNILIHSNGQERMVVTVGVEDIVVVDTGDVLLICSRERSQDLRKVIELLKEKGLQQYL
ncbi:MAG: mannose-1-phosphate guanylyltransferase [Anaerolineales bacterium]|nr:mannose-1-phosphate guanylyltransferase [Anaerolineales bacterium]